MYSTEEKKRLQPERAESHSLDTDMFRISNFIMVSGFVSYCLWAICYRLGGLKWQKFFLPLFWKPEVGIIFTGTVSWCQQDCTPSRGLWRNCSCLFRLWLLLAFFGLWPHHPISASMVSLSSLFPGIEPPSASLLKVCMWFCLDPYYPGLSTHPRILNLIIFLIIFGFFPPLFHLIFFWYHFAYHSWHGWCFLFQTEKLRK